MKSSSNLWVGALWQAATPLAKNEQKAKPVEAMSATFTPPAFEVKEQVIPA
ncbi:MAG: hypothetical protein ACRCVV_07370 [Shewanella sp.]